MQEIDAIAEQVSILVYNSPHHSIIGSALAPLVKRAFPEFDPVQFGCLNLRDFLRRYVKDVFESGRSGSDVLYSVLRLPSVGEASAREQEFAAITRMPVARPAAPSIGPFGRRSPVRPEGFGRTAIEKQATLRLPLRRNQLRMPLGRKYRPVRQPFTSKLQEISSMASKRGPQKPSSRRFSV